MTSRVAVLLAGALLLLAGCGTPRAWFEPREGTRSQSPDGWSAAEYALESPSGDAVGTVRVWSEGARKLDDSVVEAHLGLEIENRSGFELRVDVENTDLRAFVGDGAEFAPDTATYGGALTVPSDDVGIFDLRARLPGDVDVRELQSFRGHWRVVSVDGDLAFDEITPFVRWSPQNDRDFYWGRYPYPFRWRAFGPSWCW